MKTTIAQLQKQARTAQKFVLFTDQFGYNIYIADSEKSGGFSITPDLEEALEFSVGFDNAEMKLKAWSYSTGYVLKVKTL